MTPKQVHAKLKDIAYTISHVAESDFRTQAHFDRMVTTIREGEKQHQSGRPSSCPREISLSQATNWFIVRCTIDALNHPNRTVAELSQLREAFVWAHLMVETAREKFSEALSVEECGIVELYDYPAMKPVGK